MPPFGCLVATSAPRLDSLSFRVAALAPLSPGRDDLRSSFRARPLDLVSPSAFIRLAKGRVTSPCSPRASSISVSFPRAKSEWITVLLLNSDIRDGLSLRDYPALSLRSQPSLGSYSQVRY